MNCVEELTRWRAVEQDKKDIRVCVHTCVEGMRERMGALKIELKGQVERK